MAFRKAFPLRQRLPSVGELSAKQTERLYEDEPLPNHAKKQAPALPGGGLLCFYLLRDIGLGDGRIQLIGGRGGVRCCFSALLLLAGRFLLFGLAALGAALAANVLCQQQERTSRAAPPAQNAQTGSLLGTKATSTSVPVTVKVV